MLRRLPCQPELQDRFISGPVTSSKAFQRKVARKINRKDIKLRLIELFKNGLTGLEYRYIEGYKPAYPEFDP